MGLNIKSPKNAGKNTSHKHQIRGVNPFHIPPREREGLIKG
jgi:hypothetical protein